MWDQVHLIWIGYILQAHAPSTNWIILKQELQSWTVLMIWLTNKRRLALFPAGTIARDSHHRKYLTRRELDLNLSGTWLSALMNEVVQQWSLLHHVYATVTEVRMRYCSIFRYSTANFRWGDWYFKLISCYPQNCK